MPQTSKHSLFPPRETIATKYEGKLQKEMAGPTYETFSKVMKFVVGQKIFVPGNFVR